MSTGNTLTIMIIQVVAMFVMMAIGIALYETKFIDNKGSAQLANITLYVSTPAVVLGSLATTFSPERLVMGAWCMALSALFTALGALISRLVYHHNQPIAQIGIMISNMGFLGIPLVQSVIGEEYVFYVSACIAAQVPFIWTYGVWLLTHDRSLISATKIFTNPSIIAVIVGVVLFLFSVELTGVFDVTATDMGNLNTGLAMLILGAYLAQTDIRSLLRDKNLYLANFLRLVVVPAAALLLMLVLPLDTPVKLAVLIAIAAPCGTLSAMLPQKFGGDYRFGAGLVSSSTLLSLISMPVVLAVGLAVL